MLFVGFMSSDIHPERVTSSLAVGNVAVAIIDARYDVHAIECIENMSEIFERVAGKDRALHFDKTSFDFARCVSVYREQKFRIVLHHFVEQSNDCRVLLGNAPICLPRVLRTIRNTIRTTHDGISVDSDEHIVRISLCISGFVG